jgi:hypothetical protein
VRKTAFLLPTLALVGCNENPDSKTMASTCGVSIEVLKKALKAVRNGQAMQDVRAGKCLISKGSDGHVRLGFISEPPAAQQ